MLTTVGEIVSFSREKRLYIYKVTTSMPRFIVCYSAAEQFFYRIVSRSRRNDEKGSVNHDQLSAHIFAGFRSLIGVINLP